MDASWPSLALPCLANEQRRARSSGEQAGFWRAQKWLRGHEEACLRCTEEDEAEANKMSSGTERALTCPIGNHERACVSVS